jgi:hypothetical protein
MSWPRTGSGQPAIILAYMRRRNERMNASVSRPGWGWRRRAMCM